MAFPEIMRFIVLLLLFCACSLKSNLPAASLGQHGAFTCPREPSFELPPENLGATQTFNLPNKTTVRGAEARLCNGIFLRNNGLPVIAKSYHSVVNLCSLQVSLASVGVLT